MSGSELSQRAGLPCDGQRAAAKVVGALEPLTHLDRICLAALAIAFLIFGGLVQIRSSLLARHCGDLKVFSRAAWAARTGHDLYEITDDNGFHYLYPPTFAVLLAPLADAPAGESRDGLLPYPSTVLYWYFFNVVCLLLSAHWLASALEEGSPATQMLKSSPADRRWWGLRLWPVLACLPPIGHTLSRGQVGILLLLLLSGMIVSVVRGKSGRAGLCLAAAICLKVIPALLLVYPLLRKDYRFLGACLVGLLVGLVGIPVAARGARQTIEDYRRWDEVMLAPSLARGSDTSRADEVLNVTATDSQSFLAMIHNTWHLNRETRPKQASAITRWSSRAAAGALLAAWLLLLRRHKRPDTAATVLLLGALIEVMLLASPVCHLHYFCLSVPLIAGLFAVGWEQSAAPRLGLRLGTLVFLNIFANVVPEVPGLEVWRDIGLAGYSAILLFIISAVVLWWRAAPAGPQQNARPLSLRAAA